MRVVERQRLKRFYLAAIPQESSSFFSSLLFSSLPLLSTFYTPLSRAAPRKLAEPRFRPSQREGEILRIPNQLGNRCLH